MFEDFRRSFVELVSAVRDMFSSTAQRGQTLAGAFEEMTPEQRRVALVELETDREMLKLAYLGVLQQREELQEACDELVTSNRQLQERLASHDAAIPLRPGYLHETVNLIARGKFIQAVKLVRDCTNWGLKDAKEFVEELRRQLYAYLSLDPYTVRSSERLMDLNTFGTGQWPWETVQPQMRCWHLNNGLDRCVHCGEVVEWSPDRGRLVTRGESNVE